jgi:phosphocarrier protein FPr
MVGLVVVSHSRALADALVRLVRQVGAESIPVAAAGGVGKNRSEFGSDAVEIAEAVVSVYGSDGVLVLMDLGGALLSAETALELLDESMRPNVRLSAGPLVEGAIAAGVQIGLGSDLETVFEEARQALVPKFRQLSSPDEPETFPGKREHTSCHDEPVQEIVVTLNNPHGLHARPCARFVQTAAMYDAEVKVCNRTLSKGPVPATSINSLAMLGAVEGHQISISAGGKEAGRALDALRILVEEGFGEAAGKTTAVREAGELKAGSSTDRIQAIPISDGIAVGPLCHYQAALARVTEDRVEDPEMEWQRFEKALAAVSKTIQKRRQKLTASLGKAEAAIFDAHLLILKDPLLLDRVREKVFQLRQNAAAAWEEEIREIAEKYRALPDTYLQQRAADVIDVGNQLLFSLSETDTAMPLQFSEPAVLIAHELTPTQTVQLDLKKVLALVTVGGGPNSHSAILARALGIPSIAGVDAAVRALAPGTMLAVDGFSGTLWIDPPSGLLEEMKTRQTGWEKKRRQFYIDRQEPAVTRDGRVITIAGNAGNIPDADRSVRNGADAIGLLRTEFLYLSRSRPPTEEEQRETLYRIGTIMGKRPVQIRTLDAGGDKPLPFMKPLLEANPFLGLRAVRLSLQEADLFSTQLRAILRAGNDFHFRIMFPMIARAEELEACIQLLAAAHHALESQNLSHRWPIETGIMVETPAAALSASSLARQVDFFSIGTNDLTQYTLAAERGNPALSDYADGLHPTVLFLIRRVLEAAHREGKPVGVCGELAGDPTAIPVLAGLGVDELSLNPEAIPHAKAIIRNLDMADATVLAEKALQADRASAVRHLAAKFTGEE